MSGKRTDLPVALNGALDWSGGPTQTEDELLDLLNSQKKLKRELKRATCPPQIEGGRPRLPGQWAVAYLLFVASSEPTISRWHNRTSKRIWQRCGFRSKPKYDTVHHHFARLEGHPGAVRTAASTLMMLAVKKSGGKVGRDIHVDGTEAESNTRAYHDCEPGTCPRGKPPGRSPLAKAPTPTAQEERQQEAGEIPGTESHTLDPVEVQNRRGGKRVKQKNGCWYWISDPSAGIRVHSGPRGRVKRFWVGFNNMKAIDHYTGAVIANITVPADVNEASAYPSLLNQAMENTGVKPRGVVADRGFSLNQVFELNTKAGIASVIHWRKQKAGEKRDSVGTEYFDQHGIPLCQKCGGPTTQIRFAAGDNPRIWFRCDYGCGEGSIVCNKGWRYLLPLARTSEAYMALRHSHSHYEKAHWRWRDQWKVGPDNASNRPRRRGIECQELRGQAALLLEWLIVCHREGWLGGKRINTATEQVLRAKRQLERLLKARVKLGLHLKPADRPSHLKQLEQSAKARAG